MDGLLGSASWESFKVMSPRFDLSSSGNSSVDRSRLIPAAVAQRLLDAGRSGAWVGSVASPRLPQSALGKTYVFDVNLHRYVPAADRIGAPANGVRFILYAVNPITHEPIIDVEVGHADLLDIGAARPSGIGLRLLVVSQGQTFLDYTVFLDGSETAGSLSAAGFLTDGATRLEFQIMARGRNVGSTAMMDIDFHFEIPDRGFSATGKLEGTHSLTGETQRVNLAVRTGQTTIGYSVSGNSQVVDATILVDGQVFATVRGDHRNPVILGAGGRQLTAEEVKALGRLVQLAGEVFEIFGHLLRPVEMILLLSTIP